MDLTLVLEKYQPIKDIFIGGQSMILLAKDNATQQEVILKVYRPQGSITLDSLETVRKAAASEAEFLSQARQDNREDVPYIIETGESGLYPVLVMKPIYGENLEAIISRPGFNPSIWEAMRIVKSVAETLNYAHHSKVEPFIHRDIKPANIMIDQQGKVKIVDWSTNTQIYTPNFTAPEVLEGKTVTIAADIYSTCAVMQYYLQHEKFVAQNGQMSESDYNGTNVPSHWPAVFRTGREVNPTQRYQSMDELVGVLERPLIIGALKRLPEYYPFPLVKRDILVSLNSLCAITLGVFFDSLGLATMYAIASGVAVNKFFLNRDQDNARLEALSSEELSLKISEHEVLEKKHNADMASII